jgi:ABC-type spermidine/putrescine transport system, permease component I
VAPIVLFDLAVFVVPFGYLLRISLTERTSRGAFVEGSWSIEGFEYVLSTPTLVDSIIFTLGFATGVTALSLGISLLYAYAIWRATGGLRVLLLVGVLVSMLTAIIVKLFAVILLFSPSGFINQVIVASGIVAEPLPLINNVTGAVIGQLYIVVPYSVLAIYSVLSSVDQSVIEAARDLGAGRLQAVAEVVVPHTIPGLIVAGVISFTWSVGSFAAPLLVGSSAERTTGIAISDLLQQNFDWTAAAAMGLLVAAMVFAALSVTYLALERTDGGDDA